MAIRATYNSPGGFVVRLTFSAPLFDMSLVLIHSEPASISTVGWTKWHILAVESGVPRQTE